MSTPTTTTDTTDNRRERRGPFRIPIGLDDAKRQLFERRLLPFWSLERILAIFLPIVEDCNPISLRMLDWLCTNYAKRRSVVCVRKHTSSGDVEFIDICQRYKQECAEHRRAGFDPFARAHGKTADDWMLLCDVNDHTIRTTVAQLNFLRWAEENEVLRYARDHRDEIAVEMRENQIARRSWTNSGVKRPRCDEKLPRVTERKKRKQITPRPSPSCRAFPLAKVQLHVYGGDSTANVSTNDVDPVVML